MEKREFKLTYAVAHEAELCDADRQLVRQAREATATSFAPYSNFHVGAALRLANGMTLQGSNQENASFTTGTCAERCTVFYANARYPQDAVEAIAIAARRSDGSFTPVPVSPCGACRQVLAETEARFGRPMRVLLCGSDDIYIIESAADLLPLSFGADAL